MINSEKHYTPKEKVRCPKCESEDLRFINFYVHQCICVICNKCDSSLLVPYSSFRHYYEANIEVDEYLYRNEMLQTFTGILEELRTQNTLLRNVFRT